MDDINTCLERLRAAQNDFQAYAASSAWEDAATALGEIERLTSDLRMKYLALSGQQTTDTTTAEEDVDA